MRHLALLRGNLQVYAIIKRYNEVVPIINSANRRLKRILSVVEPSAVIFVPIINSANRRLKRGQAEPLALKMLSSNH